MPPLPSRRGVLEQVSEALKEMEASPEPVLLLLVAEWGEGKTSVYNARIRPWLEKNGWRGLEARAATVLAHLRSLRGRAEKSPALRLLAAVLAAGLEQEGRLGEYGAPEQAESLQAYVRRVLGGLGGGRLLVFIDELEDIVAGVGEEELGELVAGLLGLVNGDVEAARGGRLHLVASLTPPAYSRLMGLRDFATVASRLRRRIRVVWIRPLPRREALAFLESLARYSLGTGLDGLLEDHGLGNAVVSGSLGNMGALVSAFRYLVSWARGRGGCGDAVKRLTTGELLEALQGLTLSVGGTELPALNMEAYGRLREGWLARARLSGLDAGLAERLLDELVARGAAGVEELEAATSAAKPVIDAAVGEMNVYAERGWLRRELGVRRLVYRVRLVPAVEDAFKLLRAVEPEAEKILPQLVGDERTGSPLEQLLDSLVYSDPRGRQVVAIPGGWEEAVDLVGDASPVELGRGEAERLAQLLWRGVFQKLAASEQGVDGYLLSPRVQRLVYVSPELGYLDFIAGRAERLQVLRRVYTAGGPGHLLAGAVAVLSQEGLVEQAAGPQGEAAARIVARLPGGGLARVLAVAVAGQVTQEAARMIESQVSTALLSGWRPHAVLVLHHGGVEPSAARILENLEAKLFTKIVYTGLQSLVSRVRLQALGVKLLEAAGGLEKALSLAARLPGDRRLAEDLGLDPLRLQQVLRELGDELTPRERLQRGLEEGVDGAPLVIRDPRLWYDVEKPTELAGALRYFLVVPSTKATPQEALRAAYEYVLRYHLYRGAGGEARGIMSPDIEQGEVGTLEKYMMLLAANGFLEKTNGSVRVDTLAPMERSVLRALEQLGARTEEVPAARIWDALVVEARNPGTRRMLLQSLAYRGLVEVHARRVDPERSRVRLRDTETDAASLIAEAEELLARLEADKALQRWGLIVSAKARGIRAGSLEALASKMRQLLGVAREALRAGDVAMSLRLAKTARDVLSYALEELAPLARDASRQAGELRRTIAAAAERIRSLAEEASTMLSQLTGVEAKLEPPGLHVLEEALRRLDEVEEMDITEQQLDEETRRLWAEARRRNPRRPGEATPFYIQGTGPLLRFNYRLYLAARALEELGVARLEPGKGIVLSGEAARALERLERLVTGLQSLLEDTAELRRRLGRLTERLQRLGAPAPAAPAALASTQPPASEAMSLEEAEELYHRLRLGLEDAWRPLRRLEELAEKLLDQEARLEELLGAETEAWLHALEEAAEKAREAGMTRQAVLLEEERRDLEMAARQAKEHRARARERLAASTPEPQALIEAMEEARSLLESAELILRDSLEQAKRRHREALEEAERLRHSLASEAAALLEALRRAGVETPQPPSGVEGFEAVKTLRGLLEELRRLAREAGVLVGEELEAYTLIAQERRRRGELLFREAVHLVANTLHISHEEAKKLLLRLIEKGVLEPRI